MQNDPLASHENTGRKPYPFSATIFTGTLEVSCKLYRHLASSLTEELSDLCPVRSLSTRSWHERDKQSDQHANPAQHGDPVAPLLSLALLSRAEH